MGGGVAGEWGAKGLRGSREDSGRESRGLGGNLEAWEGVLRLGRGPRRPTCKGLAGGRAGGSGVEGGQAALNVGLEGRDELAELRRARRARNGRRAGRAAAGAAGLRRVRARVGMGDEARRRAGRAAAGAARALWRRDGRWGKEGSWPCWRKRASLPPFPSFSRAQVSRQFSFTIREPARARWLGARDRAYPAWCAFNT